MQPQRATMELPGTEDVGAAEVNAAKAVVARRKIERKEGIVNECKGV